MSESATTPFLSSAWLKPLWEKLQAIRGERDQQIQQLLKDFADPRELARFYIEPDCQQINPANRHEDTEPQSVVKSSVFKTINDFLEGDFAVMSAGRNQMFVLSDAGMGKSSLLVMLRLAQLLKFWPAKIHCELLKLGPDTLQKITALPAPGDTVLLLDALDEDPTAWGNIRDRLLDLLEQTKHFRRVILSCRTQFFPETGPDTFQVPGRVKVDGYSCPMIFLSLFDRGQVGKYLEKRYPKKWLDWFGENTRKAKALGLVEKMKDLCCRPMLLAHIEDLVDSRLIAGEWGEYQVYRALTEAWLEREQRKLREQKRPEVTAAELRTACRAVAWHLQSKGARTMSEKDLNALVGQHQQVSHLREIQFGGRSLLNRNADGDYRFSHFSIQEFLVAEEILATAREQARVTVPEFATEKVTRFVLDGRAGVCRGKPLTLRGLDLKRFDFHEADLSDADLSRANLFGANLTGANLTGANLSGTDFSSANLTNANLSGAIGSGARFNHANLAGIISTRPIEGLPFSVTLRREIPPDSLGGLHPRAAVGAPSTGSARLGGAKTHAEPVPGAPGRGNGKGATLEIPRQGGAVLALGGGQPGVAMEFVWIPRGKFQMGGDGQEEFSVTLSRGFWLGKFPVTQEQYEILAGENPSHFKKSGRSAPVENVNWEEAAACCRRLGEMISSVGGGDAVVGRLPTEAEWEYACRAGTQTKFSFGDDAAQLGDHAWYWENSGGKTHPVGQKKPNAWGLYDMHGNVWEWCQDGKRAYTKEAQVDPVGPTEGGGSRVLRGGSWRLGGSDTLLSSYRTYTSSDFRRDDIGFRCVLAGVSSR